MKEISEAKKKREFGLFKLSGLSRPRSATLETKRGEYFNASIEHDDEDIDALWNFCDGHWNEPKLGMIRHEGLSDDGTPINPVLIQIQLH